MKTVILYETFDRMLHRTKKEATKHLDILYGDILCKISHNLVQLSYTKHCEYIDNNLDVFAKLIKIKSDFELINEEDE